MSQIINEIASIEVDEEILRHVNVGDICRSFAGAYRKLDDLRKFRSEYEKKNFAARWWHNDKLRDAQLDSAEAQAEFSKTIGQLMMVSIMQSKKLSEQQVQLNDQQDKLKYQADGIEEHAARLEDQHRVLADQSERLEALVREYFELKGLTEDGAQRLIEIAQEIKVTKQGLLEEFSKRKDEFETLCDSVRGQIESLSESVAKQIHVSAERIDAVALGVQQATHERLAANESLEREEREALRQSIEQKISSLEKHQFEAHEVLKSKFDALDSKYTELNGGLERQGVAHSNGLNVISNDVAGMNARFLNFSKAFSKVDVKVKRIGYVVIGLSIVVVGMLGGAAYFLK